MAMLLTVGRPREGLRSECGELLLNATGARLQECKNAVPVISAGKRVRTGYDIKTGRIYS
jgi:hypothetical protein